MPKIKAKFQWGHP